VFRIGAVALDTPKVRKVTAGAIQQHVLSHFWVKQELLTGL
jgi:hypothetical protein